jgi:ligand-binding sensor domain-containing protein
MAGARVNDIVVTGAEIWVATSIGVARRAIAGASSVAAAVGDGTGTVSQRDPEWRWVSRGANESAWALAPGAGGVWVGTDRGLRFARLGDARMSSDVNGGPPVHALARSGDSLWVGTSGGLRLVAGAGGSQRPVFAPGSNVLDRAIRSLAVADSMLAAATDDAVMLIDLRRRRPALVVSGAPLGTTVGSITALAIDVGAVWVAGERGLAIVDRATRVARPISIMLPAGTRVHDMVVDRQFVWLATPGGVLRLRRDRLGG